MMHMTFYWGTQVTLLFTSWRTESLLSYSLALLACVAAATFYQYLEHIRLRLRRSKTQQLEEPLIGKNNSVGGGWRWSAAKIGAGLAFGVSSGVGYLLMLAVMSFNGGVFVAIVLGLTAGHLAFGIQGTDEAEEDIIGVNSTCACA